MARRALSETQKKRKQSEQQKQCYAQALNAHSQDSQLGPHNWRSIAALACEFGVDNSTLGRYIKGSVSMDNFNASKRILVLEEEHIVVDFILESSNQGLPPTHREVERVVNEILAARAASSEEPCIVGVNWIDRFINCHSEELKTHWSHPLDTICAKALNPAVVHD